MNNELDGVRNKAVVTRSTIVNWRLPGGAEKNNKSCVKSFLWGLSIALIIKFTIDPLDFAHRLNNQFIT